MERGDGDGDLTVNVKFQVNSGATGTTATSSRAERFVSIIILNDL